MSVRRGLLLLLLALLLAPGLQRLGLAERFDHLAVDLLAPWLAAPPDDRVVVVEIDQQSLERLGPWPWPRALHARLIGRLADAGAAVIGYDVMFIEPSRVASADAARGDAMLEAAVAAAGNVVLPIVAESPAYGQPPLEMMPFGELPEVAAALGHTHLSADADGRLRRLSLHAGVAGAYWPAFALAIASLASEGRPPPARAQGADETAGSLGWIEREQVIVPIAAGADRTPHFSAVEIVEGPPLDAIEGAIVLVGASARGLRAWVDIGPAAGSSRVPPQRFHAAAVTALLDKSALVPLRRPDLAAIILAGAPFLVWLLALPLGRRQAQAGLNALPLTPLAIGLAALHSWHVVLPFASVTVLLILLLATLRLLELGERLRQAQLERSLAHAALTNVADAVLTTDRAHVVAYANPAAGELFDRSADEIVGQDLDRLAPELAGLVNSADVDPDDLANRPRRGRASGKQRRGTAWQALPFVAGDGSQRAIKASVRRLVGGRRTGYVIALNDVTAEQRLLDEVAFRATHDGLTKLPNRNLVVDRLTGAIERGRRQGRRVAVAFLDVDRLKSINDALGHAVGDSVLIELADRLRHAGRATDTVGRLGGDEFVLLLEDLASRAEVETAIARYRASFRDPVRIQGRALEVKASIGVACFPDDGDTGEALLRRADAAMYRAKTGGRDQLVFYDSSLHGEEEGGLLLDAALRQGIERDELALHYQPRIDLVRRRPSALESLVRWQHPDLGFLPPGRFIGLAEETGSIVELGRWVLTRACADLAGPGLRHTDLRLSINVSVVQLKRDQGFVDFVATTLRRHGLKPGRLELEITESLFLDPSLPMLGRRLAELASLGVHLSIDDFGTGYSSLAYINRFPFDRIKIDRSFVHALGRDQGAQAIVRAIVGLSEALAKETTAEGVEEDAQLAFLDRLKCNEAQGYLLGRPVPLAELALAA